MSDHPIFHMASFSRSGETLLLRCLDAHPDIAVVHQIREPDTPEDLALFRHLKDLRETTIAADHPALAHRGLRPGAALVLKNAVWTHGHPRRGFTLVRNPFSVVVSAYRHVAPKDPAHQRNQQIRWCRAIDPVMLPFIEQCDIMDGFLALYARKMLQDRRDGLPFLRYEDFVADPETWLRRIVAHMGLDWSDRVLKSHEDYAEGETGHGRIKLWQPIHAGSTDRFKAALSAGQAARIHALTHEVLAAHGYDWDGTDLTVRADVPGIL
ncbi:Sulfotransferase domain protein [Roseivivax jejudonensis]|uniref:Sulfotransferase domain protein n=1 Tax=Roseivivax jejudonensis TaxID=1529041 RepID=A0A1X6YWY7_9RHOB|nr:sulfotransferase [Roseivivax jejudonensis]SLN33218.1 Sulfotransferase domain protein [Roseivivax jejudonensis]